MENVFDLQRFAEAEAAPEAAAPEAAPEEAPEAPKEEIPAELAGISEDSAREAMAQAKAQAAKEAPAEDAADGAVEEAAEDAAGLTGQKIPYVRFKQEHDRKKELEAQLKDLSSEVERLRAQQAPPQPQQAPAMQQAPQVQQAQAPQVQQPRITPEATKQLNAIVRQQALQLTGFSKEDVDALSYMDDDDPRREQWKTAVDVARTQVIDGVYKMQQQRAAQAQQFMALHNAAVADYNAFAQKELLKKGSDVSPFPNDMDDWLLEYVNIRASMSNEFDIGQETQVMQNIITQVESMLHGLSPHGIQTEGYWNGAMPL